MNPRSKLSGLRRGFAFLLILVMAEGKNKIIVYADWIEIFEPLSDEEAGKLIKHFFRYVNDYDPASPDRLTTLLFDGSIKPTLKRDLKKWEEMVGKRSDAGKISAEKRKQHPPTSVENDPTKSTSVESVEQTSTKSTDNDNVKDKDIVIDNETDTVILLEKETKRFRIPDVTEIEHHLIFDKNTNPLIAKRHANEFFNFYESNGWKVGKNKMKNWKAALSGWISRAENFKPKNNGAKKSVDEAVREFLGG